MFIGFYGPIRSFAEPLGETAELFNRNDFFGGGVDFGLLHFGEVDGDFFILFGCKGEDFVFVFFVGFVDVGHCFDVVETAFADEEVFEISIHRRNWFRITRTKIIIPFHKRFCMFCRTWMT